MPAVLSIQSQVIHGHVGNSAALLPLMRHGYEVWAVPAAILAQHPGHAAQYPGAAPVPHFIPPAAFAAWIDALAARPDWAQLAGLLTGWLGRVDFAAQLPGLIDRLQGANPAIPYLCDPVLGDADTGLYVQAELAGFIRDVLLPRADICTPNHFELDYLTGTRTDTLAGIMAAATGLLNRMKPSAMPGTRCVVVTSLRRRDAGLGRAEALAITDDGAWLAHMPDLGSGVAKGSGDLFAALFLVRLLRGKTPKKALGFAMAGCYGLLKLALQNGDSEMPYAQGQEEFCRPSREPEIQRLR
ncbi:pyridoxal kinase [Ferrovibrio sp.]|uniref:pyridoxal kinase n=1 Tax=Ferrovibrio sp. TaxID=1917215 RepID=UPI0035B0FA45